MKKKYLFIIILSFVTIGHSIAQTNLWDMGTTSILVDRNKTVYSRSGEVRDNQFKEHAAATLMKNTKDKCKRLVDSLDKRLTSVYIVVADAAVAYQIGASVADIYDYQKDAFNIVTKHPEAAILYITSQDKIIKDVESMYKLIAMIILSYGEVSKMNVSERKIVYTHILSELNYLKVKNQVLVAQLKAFDLGKALKNDYRFNFINRDGDAVKKIIYDWKF